MPDAAECAEFGIFALESRGPKVFTSFDADLFSQTVQIAASHGIYNSLLVTGLYRSLVITDLHWHSDSYNADIDPVEQAYWEVPDRITGHGGGVWLHSHRAFCEAI